jgi:hypothetical protein
VLCALGYLSSVEVQSAHASHHAATFDIWKIVVPFGVIIGILAAIQQFGTWIHRRKKQKAQDELLEEYQLTKDAKTARKDVEQYTKQLEELRHQMDTQLPIQARRDYLAERLEQLRRDLYHDFNEYQEIEKELADTRPETSLDRRIRLVVETSIVPEHRLQERRDLYTLLLVLALVVINISPYSLNRLLYSYFNVLGYSDQWSVSDIAWTMLFGFISLTVLFVFATSLVTRTSRIWHVLTLISGRLALALLCLAVIGLAVAGDISRNIARNDASSLSATPPDSATPETIAGFAFNIIVLLLSVLVASYMLRLRDRRLKQK